MSTIPEKILRPWRTSWRTPMPYTAFLRIPSPRATDPEVVAEAQKERREYHESMDTMTDILYRMRDEGASMEEMARAVSEERNRLRLESYKDDPKGLAEVKESNLKTYGHEEGPTPDQLYEKYGSWTVVLQKAFSPNMGMDACCGLYDEYYWLYIELGYVE